MNVYDYLINNLEEKIEIVVEKCNDDSWGKSLQYLPMFTIKEIKTFRLKSGKGQAIIKTRDI